MPGTRQALPRISSPKKTRLAAPDIRYFPAIQFKSRAAPAITNAQPANITNGQRLRG